MHIINSRLIYLDYCFVFVNPVGVFLEQVHRTLKGSDQFTPVFLIISLYFAYLLAHVASTKSAATFTSNLNGSQTSIKHKMS